ncbi:thermonuclease family protein [Chenggangzhangella methanolivorans]|uniref:thermonuclease family protein n=1 Tax=Chenggangzhangella methanolivorans TaxID=1437009 RepID=UPI00361A303F
MIFGNGGCEVSGELLDTNTYDSGMKTPCRRPASRAFCSLIARTKRYVIRTFGGALAAFLVLSGAFTVPGSALASDVYDVDGDTLDASGERIPLRSEAGPIDAPEFGRAKCPLELLRAQAAQERLEKLKAPNDFSIDRRGRDRYGRTVTVVYSVGEDVGARLVREGHAKPWSSLLAKDRPT